MTLDTLFNESQVSGNPYVTATFTDVSGGVQVTLSPYGLSQAVSASGSPYIYNGGSVAWYFNVADAYAGKLSISGITKTGSFTFGTSSLKQGSLSGSSGGIYDWGLVFSGTTYSSYKFTQNESLTFTLTSSVAGLDASDFFLLANDGLYMSEARFEGCHGWLGAEPTEEPSETVPDGGATAGLLGLAALGLVAFRRTTK
jgi:hypothetical protein